MNSKTIRFVSLGAVVLTLLSCSSSTSEDSKKTPDKATTTTAVVQETGDCTRDVVEAAVGEPSIIDCYGVWATAMPNSYAGACTECESVWLYKWESGNWNLKGKCNQYVTLPSGCSGLEGTIQNSVYTDEMAEVPDPITACEIWDANTWTRNMAETGCTPSAEAIKYDRTEPCVEYFSNSYLPLGRCDKGRGVRSIQKRLIAGGAQIDLDGYFGTGTVIAVMDFQTAKGLPMSGYVDDKTWKALIPNQTELPGADSNGDGIVTPDEFQ
jgi:hypothetical protein